MSGASGAFSPPDEFDGYRLSRLVGRGAMGQVYLARDTVLDRAVAVKFLAALDPSPAARERFLIEARAIARLSHPNVVAIHRVAEVAGRPYLVSEFIRGLSLDKLELPVAPEQLLSLAIGLAAGLAAAHRRGVLHRDLKPANALLSEDGEVKLCDFGLAKLLDASPAAAPRARSTPAAVPAAAAALGDLDDTPVLEPDPVAATAPAASTPGRPPAPSEPITPDLGLTRAGALVGTPLYLAPELWRGEPASVRSDLYALGAILYQLASGRTPHQATDLDGLRAAVAAGPPPALADVAPAAPPRLAALVDRCLRADPAERPASADALRVELDALAAPPAPVPEGSPYRGLRAFEAEHRGLFFGRRVETLAILEQLRAEPLVVVAGDSGAGKSSLCRAGVLPLVSAGALGDGRAWTIARWVPGRHPRASLAGALAAAVGEGTPASVLELALAAGGLQLARALGERLGAARGLCLFADQLEELVTEAAPGERALVAEALAELADRVPGVRVLATVRGDFLTRVAALPGLGRGLGRALYLLGPLGPTELREAIVGPARAAGVRFEHDTLVDALVAAAEDAPGALPLLQFALAELWERRDVARAVIPAAALIAIGGVAGALARHADGVLAALSPAERDAARRLLTQLVTTEGTRARRGEAELAGDDATAAAALAALVRGRLLAARRTDDGAAAYEVAHEALLSGWDTLRGWLDRDAGQRAVRERLAAAAAEWERLGAARVGLWGAPQLGEAARVELTEALVAGRERRFLIASRRDAGRRRWGRRALVAAVPLAALAVWGGVALQARAGRARAVDARLAVAAPEIGEAARLIAESDARRAAAAKTFDRGEVDAGEAEWARALALVAEADTRYTRASQSLEAALQLDPDRGDVRARLADVLYERARLAEAGHRTAQVAELLERMRLYDASGERMRRWGAPARVTLGTSPAARVTVQRYVSDGAARRLLAPLDLGSSPIERELEPGSYLFTLVADGRPPVRYPVLLARGARFAADVALPAELPAGFLYVPPGAFRYGSRDDAELRRTLFYAQPEHEVTTGGYLIARHEVSWADWIDYLSALPPAEREERRPRREDVALDRDAGGTWRLTLEPSSVAYVVRAGEPLRYPERARNATQDWRRMPVTGIRPEDAVAYATWLRTSGRLGGARLCSEHEWERAARGADDRLFPSGDLLGPDDANVDITYERKSGAFGPDEVGSHPASDSPFGVADLAGNAWELVTSPWRPDEIWMRGGGYYEGLPSARSNNRNPTEPGLSDRVVGLRICATPAAG